jgi:ribosomal protein S18 acetylase RimI-like enzyme
MTISEISFSSVTVDDFEDLLALRILVMQTHLERLGRYHPERARRRFKDGFQPNYMRKIWVGDKMAGVVSIKPHPDGLELEHFYLKPELQNDGIGSRVLQHLMSEADEQQQMLNLGVLKQSPAARFYERHGFHKVGEDTWDIYYQRPLR